MTDDTTIPRASHGYAVHIHTEYDGVGTTPGIHENVRTNLLDAIAEALEDVCLEFSNHEDIYKANYRVEVHGGTDIARTGGSRGPSDTEPIHELAELFPG